MKHRTAHIIETLKRLPAPEYRGQVYRTHVITEAPELGPVSYNSKEPCNESNTIITVEAVQYVDGSERWLEWVMDL